MPIYQFEGLTPVVDKSAFVHPTAVLIGDVIIGPNVYIGPFASLRGDYGRLVVKKGANIQDHCMMHGYSNMETIVEENGHIGHGAILHTCSIGQNALIGMNSVVMDGAYIGTDSIVAAHAFVKAGFQGKPRQLLVGIPAKCKRFVTDEELAWKNLNTQEYQDLAQRSQATMKEVVPFSEIEEGRPTLKGSTDVTPLYIKK